MNPRISVIIPSYNSAGTIERVLKGVLDQPKEFLKEVLVVDSSDDADTRSVLAKYESGPVRVVVLNEKCIPATARNIGAGEATGEFLVFLDADAVPAPDWLGNISRAFGAGRRVGSGSVEIPDYQRRNPVALAQFFLQFNEYMAVGRERLKKFSPSCNLFCEKKLFTEIGGFSEIRAAEDVLFGLKVSRVGKFWFVPEIRVFHIFRQDMRAFLANQELLGKFVLIYRRSYYNRIYYRGFLPALYVIPGVAVKFLRIAWRIFASGSVRHIGLFLASCPFFFVGLFFWGAGFFNACFSPVFAPAQFDGKKKARQKILFITNLLPYPLDNGGKIRTYNTLVALQGFCDIDLVSFIDKRSDVRFIPDVKKMTLSVECVYKRILLHRDPLAFFWQGLKSLFHPYPYVILKYSSGRMRQLVRRKLLESSYDRVYVDHLQLFQYVPEDLLENYASRIVLDQHNVESDIVKSMMQNTGNVLKKIPLAFEYRKLLLYEKKACVRAGLVLAITEQNCRRFKDMTKGTCRCFVAPFFIQNAETSPAASEPVSSKVMLFMGTMSWFPNREGVLRFYRLIFKHYRLAEKGWRLLVVGSAPGADILDLRRDPAVEVSGTVDDVRPYVKRALVGIVPLHIRAGLRIKILELMASGVPVISTSIGAEGIEARHGKNIWLADDAPAFLEGLERIGSEATLRRELASNGREFIERNYSLSYAIKRYSELLGKS